MTYEFSPNMNKSADFSSLKNILYEFYGKNGLLDCFSTDILYLESAYTDIEQLWCDNLDSTRAINYLMIAEAPLWGKKKKYIYNPDTPNSQFFYPSDLEFIFKKVTDEKIVIDSKGKFLTICRKLGIVIIDISPYAFNQEDTHINYRKLKQSRYIDLIKETIPFYLEPKLNLIARKKADNLKVFFRYARVRKRFKERITETLF